MVEEQGLEARPQFGSKQGDGVDVDVDVDKVSVVPIPVISLLLCS